MFVESSDDTFRNQVVIIEIDDKLRIGLKAANVECFSWSSIKLISIDKYLEIFDDSAVAKASMLVLAVILMDLSVSEAPCVAMMQEYSCQIQVTKSN